MRPCAFCGKPMRRVNGQKGRTEEHCFPKWLAQHVLGGGDEWEHIVAASGTGEIKRRWTKRELAIVSKKVCRPCNTGWMAALERSVRGFLPALVRGESGDLNQAGQRLLAAWAVKTALCLELANPVEGEPIPEEHYRAMASLKETPPPRTQVALAMYVGDRLFFHSPMRLQNLPDRVHGYRSTFSVGRVVFTVAGHSHPDELVFMRSGGLPDLTPLIWPSQGVLSWPTPLAMDDDVFLTYAGVTLERPHQSQ